jgi:peptidoglycan/xylan/chitin deacetylase (PgdA/CDA1 family)
VRSFEDYWQEIDRTSRYDSASVIFIKAMLQYALPEATRRGLVKTLFERFVGVDSAIMATELYMTPEQLRTMNRCGMYLGSHGDQHRWLDLLDAADQATEIDGSLAFLAALDAPVCDWVMCYPYGASNASLLDLLKSRGCAIGVTTEPRVADLSRDHPLLLPRLDTNDLPVTSGFVRA